MHLKEVISESFLLLDADWRVERVQRLIEYPELTHLIVRNGEHESTYYLFGVEELRRTLSKVRNKQMHIGKTLNLRTRTPTPTVDLYATLAEMPLYAVVLDKEQVVGIFDMPAPSLKGQVNANRTAHAKTEELLSRSLLVDFPQRVQIDTTISLLVALSSEPEPGSVAMPVVLALGATVDVVVLPREGFMLSGRNEGSFVITDAKHTLPLQFKLKATEAGLGKVQIIAFQDGQALGEIIITVAILPILEEESPTTPYRHRQPITSISTLQPDLSLIILEHLDAGRPAFTIRLHAADPALDLNFKPFGPVQLRTNPSEYFRDFFGDIEDWLLNHAHDLYWVERSLGAKGLQLFDALFSPDLQALLWSLKNRIRNVQIQSEEPWIPWELCKLQGQEDGKIVEGPFLCEAFAITRWLLGVSRKSFLTLNKMGLVAPVNSGLEFTQQECNYIQSLATAERQVERIPARFENVLSGLAQGAYDAWHFSGHGSSHTLDPNQSAIYLEDAGTLTAEHITGVVKNLGLARPLIFLNGCQVGRSDLSLTNIGGWAAQFLRANAAAFIGPYWNVFDKPAYDFAEAFYNHLFAGMTIGEAVRSARLMIRKEGDPTWLAYTVFAEPTATVRS